MKFAIVLLGAGLAAAAPKAEPEAARLLFPGRSVGLGSSVAVGRTVGVVGRTVAGHVSAPACVRTPVKECVPRTVETPRKVCQTVVDVFEDTTITERCQEVITTTCTQTSEESHITESVSSTDTVKIEEGVPVDAQTLGRASGVLHRHIGKREADAEALHGSISTTLYNTRISKPVKKVRNAKKRCSPFTKQVGHPDCVSEPVKQCENIPNSNKRNVARTVCDTVVDTHEVEDCTETITEVCEQTNTYSHTTGKRVGVSVL